MARLERTGYPLPALWGNSGPQAHQDALTKLHEQTVNLPEGEIEGALLKFQTADSYAWYLVTKASPLTVQVVPAYDAWTIPAAHVRGLNREDVLAQIEQAKAFARLAAERKTS